MQCNVRNIIYNKIMVYFRASVVLLLAIWKLCELHSVYIGHILMIAWRPSLWACPFLDHSVMLWVTLYIQWPSFGFCCGSFESNTHGYDRLHMDFYNIFFLYTPWVCSAWGVYTADHLARNCADPTTNSTFIIYRGLSHNTESSTCFVNSIGANGYNSEAAKKRKSKIW